MTDLQPEPAREAALEERLTATDYWLVFLVAHAEHVHGCDHTSQLRAALDLPALAAPPPSPEPLNVERLARALIASDLIRRYSEYAIDAHEFTMAREGFDVLADQWANLIAAEYARRASTEPSVE